MKASIFNLSNDLVKNDVVRLKTIKRVQMQYMEDPTLTIEDALIKEGLVTEEQIYQLVADKMHLPLVDLSTYYIDEEILEVIPENMIEDYNVMPLTRDESTLLVAMINPLDYKAIYAIQNYTKLRVKTSVCTPSQLERKREELFNKADQATVYDEAQEFVQSQMAKTAETLSTEDQEDIEDQPIIKFVNNMISDAVRQRVSDIHL